MQGVSIEGKTCVEEEDKEVPMGEDENGQIGGAVVDAYSLNQGLVPKTLDMNQWGERKIMGHINQCNVD